MQLTSTAFLWQSFDAPSYYVPSPVHSDATVSQVRVLQYVAEPQAAFGETSSAAVSAQCRFMSATPAGVTPMYMLSFKLRIQTKLQRIVADRERQHVNEEI